MPIEDGLSQKAGIGPDGLLVRPEVIRRQEREASEIAGSEATAGDGTGEVLKRPEVFGREEREAMISTQDKEAEAGQPKFNKAQIASMRSQIVEMTRLIVESEATVTRISQQQVRGPNNETELLLAQRLVSASRATRDGLEEKLKSAGIK